jgi:peptidoglycan/LPS O-acetylase OafA/YrhL
LPVVLYHAGVPGIAGGFVGVDVFFVISGFLITGIIRDELRGPGFSLLDFYERRARRIMPALFAMLAVCFLVGFILLIPRQLVDFAKSVLATATFSANLWFWRLFDSYFATSADYAPLLHTWSLAVEEQFYLFFPLLLMALSRRSSTSLVRILVACAVLSFALACLGVERGSRATFFLLPTRAWELLVGSLLALRPLALGPRWQRELLAAVGLFAILITMVVYDRHTPFPGLAALPPCLGAAALIGAGASGESAVGKLLSLRPVVFVGSISYSLYLWHWPILAFMRLRLQSTELPPTLVCVAVLGSFALATASWAFVETPFRERARFSRRAVFTLSGAGTAAVLVAAAAIWLGKGLPQRLAPELALLAAGSDDKNPRQQECLDATPAQGLCHLGAESHGSVDFLFWGDSHADALSPAVDLAAQRSGRTGLIAARSGCVPLLGVDRDAPFTGRSSFYSECRAFNDAVFAMLQRRTDLHTVVLSARWAAYQTSDFIGVPVQVGFMTDDAHHHESRATNAVVFEQGLKRTVDAIVQTGRKVLIVGGTPEPGWDVPTKLYLHARWGDALPAGLTSAAVARHNAGVEAAFARVVKPPEVTEVPLLPTLCPGDCLTTYHQHAVYFDDDHLSTFAVRELLAPVITANVISSIPHGRLRMHGHAATSTPGSEHDNARSVAPAKAHL